jgi:hypothetical protein
VVIGIIPGFSAEKQRKPLSLTTDFISPIEDFDSLIGYSFTGIYGAE